MGFIYNGRHSDEFNIVLQTATIPYMTLKNFETKKVIGRDGAYVFEDGYDNKFVEVTCVITGTLPERRMLARSIVEWLSKDYGALIFDCDENISYHVVRTVSDISTTPESMKETFTINFECEPFSYSESARKWGNTYETWSEANIRFGGKLFIVSDGSSIQLENIGNYLADPLIKLTGIAEEVNINFTNTNQSLKYINLDGSVYIDCRNKLVYEQTESGKVNKLSNFDGDFLKIPAGVNDVTFTGIIDNLNVQFEYKNTYL